MQDRMMQSEKTLCRDNDTEANCLCPQKFHQPLQKIMVRPLPAVSHYCTSEISIITLMIIENRAL